MWLFANIGFFSAVQKPKDKLLTIRARVASDLDSLRKLYMPTLSPTVSHAGTDYAFRANINHRDFGFGLAKLGEGFLKTADGQWLMGNGRLRLMRAHG